MPNLAIEQNADVFLWHVAQDMAIGTAFVLVKIFGSTDKNQAALVGITTNDFTHTWTTGKNLMNAQIGSGGNLLLTHGHAGQSEIEGQNMRNKMGAVVIRILGVFVQANIGYMLAKITVQELFK